MTEYQADDIIRLLREILRELKDVHGSVVSCQP